MSEIIFYIDEDVNGRAVREARQRQVELITYADAGTEGVGDLAHFRYAIEHRYVLVTANVQDFKPLFDDWVGSGKQHPGMVLITAPNIRNIGLITDSLEVIHDEGGKADTENSIWWI